MDITQYTDQSNGLYNVLDLLQLTRNSTNLLLYYPNTTLIKDIITQAVMLIKQRKPFFNLFSDVNSCALEQKKN